MIKIKNLVKNYGQIEAVKSISFEVKAGEILGFLGANGAGKSTTLKIISGYLSQTSGSVHIDTMNSKNKSNIIKNMIGYLPELNPLYTDMRVYDYLKFVAGTYNIKNNEFNASLDRVVQQCGLSGVVHKKIGECSKGYKQRTGLAMAMIHDPQILLLDEPVTGLDPNQIVEIRELIKNLGQEKIVMVSSHILQEIQATVDRMIIIHNGEIVANGTTEELMNNMEGNSSLTMEIKNAKNTHIDQLNEKIKGIKITDIKENNKCKSLTITYNRNMDPREDLFNYAIQSKWIILEMTPNKENLEDVFRRLTLKGGKNV